MNYFSSFILHPYMKQPLNITIIGLGVLGGSLALALKQNVPSVIITGLSSSEAIERAKKRKAIDRVAGTIHDAVKDADIIFVCVPVKAILTLLPQIARSCKLNAIISDVGSTKNVICAAGKKLFTKKGIFVGGHPMAGSEGSGFQFADALLFQNAVYVLCVEPNKRKKIAHFTALLHAIGARVLFLSAREHDRIAATISHLPQLIAVAMMNLASERNKTNPAYLQLAAGGFRDITRIASSPYAMWNDILATNKPEVRSAIKSFRTLLTQFDQQLSASTLSHFEKSFTRAKTVRDAIPKNSKGFLHPLHDLFVSVDDKPGVLAEITTALATAKINIKDIELLKIREGRGGTFRLAFDTAKIAERAALVLRAKKLKVIE